MKTQRVDVYISGSGKKVFEIEQYNPDLGRWFNIGGTYDKYEHAEAAVNKHNAAQVLDKLMTIAVAENNKVSV